MCVGRQAIANPVMAQYQERRQVERRERGWSISKEISIPDIIAIASAFAAALISFTTLDKRLSVMEDWRTMQHERDVAQDVALRAAVLEIKSAIDELRRDLKGRE